MNSKKSKTLDPNRLLLNLTDKNIKLLYEILASTIHGKYKNVKQKQQI